jgi:hypothetical protein
LSGSASKASITGSEVVVMLFVSLIEVDFELGDGVLGSGEFEPVFDGIGEDAGFSRFWVAAQTAVASEMGSMVLAKMIHARSCFQKVFNCLFS